MAIVHNDRTPTAGARRAGASMLAGSGNAIGPSFLARSRSELE
jgi:hypothetical protein